jgi:hypothetical protein
MTRYSMATSLVPRLPIDPLPTPRIITTLPSWDGILNHSSGGGIRVDADGAATRGLMGVSGFGLGGHITTGVLGVEVTTSGPVFLSTLALGTIWALVTACWYVLFTWTVDRGRALVSKPEVLRGLQFSTGAVLSLLGIVVAAGF